MHSVHCIFLKVFFSLVNEYFFNKISPYGSCISPVCIYILCYRPIASGRVEMSVDLPELLDTYIFNAFFIHPEQGLFIAERHVQVLLGIIGHTIWGYLTTGVSL